MKRLLIFFLSCLSIQVSYSQTDYSYVQSRTMTNANGTTWLDHYDYDNGLGQVYQQVDVGITPQGNSLVTLHEYDDQRRPWRTWLPTPMSGSGVQNSSSVMTTAQTEHQDARPYTESFYEQSPIKWKSEEYRPGAAWHQAGKKLSFRRFLCGNASQEGGVLSQTVVFDDTGYLANPFMEWMTEESVDEDGLRTLTLKDREGRVCAVRRISQGENLTTYYAYDDFGNLRFVLPPESTAHFEYEGEVSPTDDVMLRYGYEYRYDNRHNCIYKRLPGCDPVYYIYDKAGRCIFTQDGVQRTKGQWTYTIPDVFGRILITGICHNTLDYTSEPLRDTTVTATRDNANNRYYGHTISGVTLSSDTLITATFYDDYSFIGHNGLTASLNYIAPPSSDYGSQGLTAPKGLQTGCVMAQLTNGNITSYDVLAQYYDDCGRVVQTRNRHYAEGYATEWIGYDFLGHVTKRMHSHNISNEFYQSETYTMAYDHAGRLTQTTHQANGGSAVTLCSNTYNELCQLTSSTQGNDLTTTYTYNVRSWPKSITTGTLFSETLYYNESFGGNTPRYDGNISAMAWKADAKNRAFRYAYDKFGRLSSAVYLEEGVANQHYDESFTYDKMGNVQSITRYGLQDNSQYGLIDDVSLYYIGNQVAHADDAVTGPNYAGAFHFRDSNGTQWDTEYEYDKNGRLTRDRNKNILQIQYNLLNLPSKTTFGDGGYINYQYSASGMKQMVSGYAPGQGYKSQFYLGNYVYGNGVKQLLVDGGYVTFSGTTPQYHFYVKDHLGNNRMVVNANGTVEQVNHYYAFGGLMGENTGSDLQDFKYNDKELDRLHGLDWYDYNARHMDAVRGVFTTMDPLCEGDYGISPYVYCINSPLNYADICGLDTIPVNDVDWSNFNVYKDVIEIGNIYVFGSGSNFSSQGGGSGLNTSFNNITSSQHLGILTTYAKEIEREYEGLNTQGKSRYAYELKKFMRKQLGYNYKENLRSLYKGKIPKIINGTSKFLGRANSGITAYNLYCEISSSNQVKVSNIVNTSLLLMSTTGVGSIIAASYLFMDIGVTYYTGHGLDIYINNTSDIFFGTNKGVVYDF